MANTAALIRESIWRNREFRTLPRSAQCTYLQLCSQKDLDCAGLLTLNIGLLAKGCSELNSDAIRHDLKTLEEQRFIFVDEDTDELFVRAYMRTAEVVKSPNIFKSALKSAALTESPKLRIEVASELRRLRRTDADEVADRLNPSEIPRQEPTNPSETLSKNETLPEPSSTSTSTRTVTGSISSYVVGQVGEGPPRPATPPPRCKKHPDGWDHDEPCRACGRLRRWDADAPHRQAAAQAAEAAAAAAAIAACDLCDHDGAIHLDAGPRVRCPHDPAAVPALEAHYAELIRRREANAAEREANALAALAAEADS